MWDAYQVFVASALDLKTHRRKVIETIDGWHREQEEHRTLLKATYFEQLGPTLASDFQAEINRNLAAPADILVAFFDSRIGNGTIDEINQIIINGKARYALVYCRTDQVESAKVLESIGEGTRGWLGYFTDEDDLAAQLKEHLTKRVLKLRDSAHAYSRLRRGTTQIFKHAPFPLARFLVHHMLCEVARQVDCVSGQLGSLFAGICTADYTGLDNYIRYVHRVLDAESGQKTIVLAVCGEKGLRNYRQANQYFGRFYSYARPWAPRIRVFRVFVERPRRAKYLSVTKKVKKDHESAPGVVPLTLERKTRSEIEKAKFCPPGICENLDEGFGLLTFVRFKRGAKTSVVIHSGVREGLTFADLTERTAVAPLLELTRELYENSLEYGDHQAELEPAFERAKRAMASP